ncbi:hypothetical protein DRW03_19430 [Corallococcus sp. H22C18031201]|nr:hypothetical protein DRW03_19430 [Corallococcus sp. H22C18031201]
MKPTEGARLNTPNVTFAGNATPGAYVNIVWEDGGIFKGALPTEADGGFSLVITPGLSEGQYRVHAQSTPSGGGAPGASSSLLTFFVDLTPPDTVLDEGCEDPSRNRYAIFKFSSSGGGIGFQCELNDAGPNPCASPMVFADLKEGPNLFRVAAFDEAGNVDRTPARCSWDVDTVPPGVPVIESPAPAQTFDGGLMKYGGTVDGGAVRIALVVDNSPPLWATLQESELTWGITSLSMLGEGPHWVSATSVDRAENRSPPSPSVMFFVDSIRPEAPLISTPTQGAWLNTPVPEFRGSAEAFSSVDISVRMGGDVILSGTGAVASNGLWTYQVPPTPALRDGVYSLVATARDLAGNVSVASREVEFGVDTLAPDMPTVSEPVDGDSLASGRVRVAGSADPSTRVELKLQERSALVQQVLSNPDGTWAVLLPEELGEGVYHLSATAIDNAGNLSGQALVQFSVDTTVPETVLGDRPDADDRRNTALFSFGSTTDKARFQCRLDESDFVWCGADSGNTQRYNDLTEGRHTFFVRAVNVAGNADPTPASFTWMVDLTPPAVRIVEHPDRLTSSRNAGFAFASDESNVTYECSLNRSDGVFSPCANPVGFVIDPPEGGSVDCVLRVRALDAAKNATPDAKVAVWEWRVDLNLPSTELTGCPPEHSNATAVSFLFSSTTAGVVFECSLEATPTTWVPCSAPYSITVSDGPHRFSVRSKKGTGTVDPNPKQCTWEVDTQRPESKFSSTPKALSSERIARFEFVSEPDARFECRQDGATYEPCTSPFSFAASDGTHTFFVRAKDLADNVDATPESYTWVVDTVAPSAPVMSVPAPGAELQTPRPALSGKAEPGSRVLIALDGAEVGSALVGDTGEWGFTVANAVQDGRHSLEVRAMDGAGNVGVNSAPREFAVDTQAPDTRILAGPEGRILTTEAAFKFASSEAGASFECKLLGDDFAPCGEETTFGDLTEGTYTLRVRARDRAGNADAEPALRTWRVYLGGDMRAKGGGISCAAGPGPADTLPTAALIGWGMWALRRRRSSSATPPRGS